MSRAVKVSVVVGTYNGARFLKDQLQSIELQSEPPDEVIISDDCSTDESVEVAKLFKARNCFPTTIIVGVSRLGVTSNFERGLLASTGDVVVLADQDDRWHQDKLGVIRSWAQNEPDSLLVVSDSELCFSDGQRTGQTVFEQARRLRLPLHLVNQGSAMAFRRSLLDLALPFPGIGPSKVSHDVWLGALADMCGGRSIILRSLQDYRRHGDAASDWPVVSTRQQSFIRRAAAGAFVDPRHYLRDRQHLLESAEERVQCRLLEGDFGISPLAPKYASGELAAIRKRLALLGKSRWLRLPNILPLVLSGAYRYFGSRWLCVKDLLV